MQTESDQVAELLRRFDKTADLELLTKALALLESTAETGAVRAAAATEKTRLFLDTFNAIDAKVVVNFNFDDVPRLNIAPPFETGLPAGAAPDEIHDSVLRSKYESELASNREKAKRYGLQLGLRRLDRDALAAFDEYASYHYRKVDEKALDSLIDQVVHSKARASSLRLHLSTSLGTPP